MTTSGVELKNGGSAREKVPLADGTYDCARPKHVSREGDDRIVLELNKKKIPVRLKTSTEREAALERWYVACPDVVNW